MVHFTRALCDHVNWRHKPKILAFGSQEGELKVCLASIMSLMSDWATQVRPCFNIKSEKKKNTQNTDQWWSVCLGCVISWVCFYFCCLIFFPFLKNQIIFHAIFPEYSFLSTLSSASFFPPVLPSRSTPLPSQQTSKNYNQTQ